MASPLLTFVLLLSAIAMSGAARSIRMMAVLRLEGGGIHMEKVVDCSKDETSNLVWVRVLRVAHCLSDGSMDEDEDMTTSILFEARVAGGRDARKGRYPYMCSLRQNSHLHRCGGVLVNETWILTAAHCVDPKLRNSVGINPVTYIGGWDIEHDENSGEEIEVVRPIRTVLHPQWNGNVRSGYDLALLELEQPSRHEPIAMIPAENMLHTGQFLVGIGWGADERGSLPRHLQQAENLEFISHQNCKKALPEGNLPDGVVCTFSRTQDTCKGDSGGPLILADFRRGQVDRGNPSLDLLVGITSYGPTPCRSDAAPGISADVAYFRDWLYEVWENMSSPDGEVDTRGDGNTTPMGVETVTEEPDSLIVQPTNSPSPEPDQNIKDTIPDPPGCRAADCAAIKFVTLQSRAESQGVTETASSPSPSDQPEEWEETWVEPPIPSPSPRPSPSPPPMTSSIPSPTPYHFQYPSPSPVQVMWEERGTPEPSHPQHSYTESSSQANSPTMWTSSTFGFGSTDIQSPRRVVETFISGAMERASARASRRASRRASAHESAHVAGSTFTSAFGWVG